MAWTTVYDVDWRDAFTALGAVDLSTAGNTLTYEGITWNTPAVVNGNPFDQDGSVSWGLVAGGLRCVSPDNSRFLATNNNAPHIYASLTDLGANSVSPFDADPTRGYLFQCFVSALALDGINNEGCGIGLYRVDEGVAVGNANIAWCVQGTHTGTANNWCRSGVGSSPGNEQLTSQNVDVPTIHYVGGGQHLDFYVAPFGADWPDNSALRFIASYRSTVETNNDITQDPPGMRVALVHNCPNFSVNGYAATIERFRILQQD